MALEDIWQIINKIWYLIDNNCQFIKSRNLGELGQILSGIGVFIAALCAWVTLITISLQQKRKQWIDDFRKLYAEFWDDKDIREVRTWIVSDMLYSCVLEPILKQRNEKKTNYLDEHESIKLDKLDKFISLLIRLETLEKVIRTKRQRALIERFLFTKYWKNKALSRREIEIYIKTDWEGEI